MRWKIKLISSAINIPGAHIFFSYYIQSSTPNWTKVNNVHFFFQLECFPTMMHYQNHRSKNKEKNGKIFTAFHLTSIVTSDQSLAHRFNPLKHALAKMPAKGEKVAHRKSFWRQEGHTDILRAPLCNWLSAQARDAPISALHGNGIFGCRLGKWFARLTEPYFAHFFNFHFCPKRLTPNYRRRAISTLGRKVVLEGNHSLPLKGVEVAV